METLAPDTVTAPPEATEEEMKLERKAKLVKALSALNTRRPSPKKESTTAETEVEAQAPANSATAITSSTPAPTPKAPAAKPTVSVAAPKFPHKQLPADDKFGLPLSPRFFEVTPREPSKFGKAKPIRTT